MLRQYIYKQASGYTLLYSTHPHMGYIWGYMWSGTTHGLTASQLRFAAFFSDPPPCLQFVLKIYALAQKLHFKWIYIRIRK